MNQDRLFDIEQIEKSNDYIDPIVKRKWSKAFREWCSNKYHNEGHFTGIFCCGNMKICDECDQKYFADCKDCVETIKKILKNKNIKIDYNDFDFEKILERVEKGVKLWKD